MQIIHIVLGKANPARMNGVNKVVHELATRQSEAGWDVQIWGITKDQDHNYPSRSFSTLLFDAPANPFALAPALKQAIAQKAATTIFHLHGGFIPRFAAIASLIKKHSGRFVFTPHGSYNTLALRKNKWVKTIYLALFESRLLKKAAGVHCLGASEVEGLHKILPDVQPYLIPYGYDAAQNITTEAEQTQKNPFTVSFCGRLDVFTKGLDVLLEGFAQFREQVPESQLWVIGDGAGKNELHQLSEKLQLKGNIHFWGGRFGVEKQNLLKQSHVFAHPSRNEGLPTSVLEAASMGIPCLVTHATNVAQNIAAYQAGAVIEEAQAADFSNALHQLYTQLKQIDAPSILSNNARSMVIEAYNWPRQLAQFETMYQALGLEHPNKN